MFAHWPIGIGIIVTYSHFHANLTHYLSTCSNLDTWSLDTQALIINTTRHHVSCQCAYVIAEFFPTYQSQFLSCLDPPRHVTHKRQAAYHGAHWPVFFPRNVGRNMLDYSLWPHQSYRFWTPPLIHTLKQMSSAERLARPIDMCMFTPELIPPQQVSLFTRLCSHFIIIMQQCTW